MILAATHTHLYPGHSGEISGLEKVANIQSGRDCLVAFSDGSAATARISQCGNGWQLDTDAYCTAAGTDIAAKRWFVRLEEDGDHVAFRILSKAQSN